MRCSQSWKKTTGVFSVLLEVHPVAAAALEKGFHAAPSRPCIFCNSARMSIVSAIATFAKLRTI